MNELLFNIFQVVMISAILAILHYFIPYVTGALRAHDYNFAADLVETAVRAAEQTITGHGRGDEKFDFVVKYIHEQMTRYGIGLTEDQVVQLIEAAVQAMNAEMQTAPEATDEADE